jgi:hypothetical protein
MSEENSEILVQYDQSFIPKSETGITPKKQQTFQKKTIRKSGATEHISGIDTTVNNASLAVARHS